MAPAPSPSLRLCSSPTAPLPEPRGPRSERVLALLTRPIVDATAFPAAVDDPLEGEDTPLALHVLYELHYRGFAGVDARWEWNPHLLALRAELEAEFEQRLVDVAGPIPVGRTRHQVLHELDRLAEGKPGSVSLSRWMLEHGNVQQLREFAVHRSIYQLKEADPHTFGIPRLVGRPKAAMVEIQKGEYGDGDSSEIHAELFATTMRALGLESTYGAYLDHVPGVTLATGNLISLFGLHRRWRGALVGHLALFEMTSVEPMRRYAATVRRLGFGDRAARFYDVHVDADTRHGPIGRNDLAGGLVDREPLLSGQIIFGARCLDRLEARLTDRLLGRWTAGNSSLRLPV
jgi:Iron-containing redox enzyme